MSPERLTRLEAVGGWVWNAIDARWEDGFTELQQFVTTHGHARVSQSYTTPGGYRLGAWVTNWRFKKKKLSPRQRKRLEALDGWVWKAR